MTSNPFYEEWDTPRPARLLRDTYYLTVKHHDGTPDIAYAAPPGTDVLIVGRMTERTKESYGGRWLYSAQILNWGALVEEGVDFEFTDIHPEPDFDWDFKVGDRVRASVHHPGGELVFQIDGVVVEPPFPEAAYLRVKGDAATAWHKPDDPDAFTYVGDYEYLPFTEVELEHLR